MITTSAFEILGPIMVGPSSSHTAGALRLAQIARSLAPTKLEHVRFVLYNSFSATYQGHGTDKALVAGILGLSADDTNVKDSFFLAKKHGLTFEFVEAGFNSALHPNTVDIEMSGEQKTICVQGKSLGGGRVALTCINGIPVEISGEYPTIFVAHKDTPGVLACLTNFLGETEINIATMKNFRKDKGGAAYTIFETDDVIPPSLITRIETSKHVYSACTVRVPGATLKTNLDHYTLDFGNGSELLELCERMDCSIGTLMKRREEELAQSPDIPNEQMDAVLRVLTEEVHATIEEPKRSLGGFLFDQAQKAYETSPFLKHALLGETLTKAVSYGMAVLERSATMGVIVAAPTAGSAGVVPGALLACAEVLDTPTETLKEALWCTCAVGAIIAANASVSGAEGGCQAEVGSASAMAAAGLVQMLGGTPKQALDAAGIAIGNLLGLVCDPARGLVEYPCQNRNAIGIANAYTSAQLALCGITNPILFDETVSALKSVGQALPESLRETAQGGLALAPSLKCISCFSGCNGCG